MNGLRSHRRRLEALHHWPTLLVLLAALPQLMAQARDAWTGTAPGSAYEPRVKAILDVSRVAARGGPYLAVPADNRLEPVDQRVNDLGVSSAAFVLARVGGRPITRRTLLWLNFALLTGALAALLAVTPRALRPALALAVALVPLTVVEYRSPDPLATHGSLSVLGVAAAASLGRPGRAGKWIACGVLLFLIHKVRSAYALYALAAITLVVALECLRSRRSRVLVSAALVLGTAGVLEVPWRLALATRDSDPRVVAQDTLGTHPIAIALLEGIGWSENRWGIKPWDPWITEYLSNRFGLPPVNVGTKEAERRAAATYLALWREAPGHLLHVYVSRLPTSARDHVFLGGAGALLLLMSLPVAAWFAYGRDAASLGLLAAAFTLTACLLFQTTTLDPRLLYAYPLRFLSAMTLMLAVATIATQWRAKPSAPEYLSRDPVQGPGSHEQAQV